MIFKLKLKTSIRKVKDDDMFNNALDRRAEVYILNGIQSSRFIRLGSF